MSEENKIQKFAEKTYKNPIAQASLVVIESVPVIGTGLAAGRKAAEQRHINILEQRKETFFSELETGGVITGEMLETEEFIHSVVVLYDAIIRTYNHEKIRRFARILLTAIEKDELASDKFEEYVRLLDGLSERELDILSALRKLEQNFIATTTKEITASKNPYNSGNAIRGWASEITLKVWFDFIEHVTHKHQIPKPILLNHLDRLEGMGLYSGTQLNYQHHSEMESIGTTTFIFEDFSEWIKLENEKLNADG